MNTRLVAAFRGNAQCRREVERSSGASAGLDVTPALAWKCCSAVPPACSCRHSWPAPELMCSRAANARWEFAATARHVPACGARRAGAPRRAAAFAAALPGTRAVATRAGWWLLLGLLRIPGLARLLTAAQPDGREHHGPAHSGHGAHGISRRRARPPCSIASCPRIMASASP